MAMAYSMFEASSPICAYGGMKAPGKPPRAVSYPLDRVPSSRWSCTSRVAYLSAFQRAHPES
jgi:hypothetical protein